jgi:hypothetical protein
MKYAQIGACPRANFPPVVANALFFVLIALNLFDINNYFCSHDKTAADFFRYFQ